MSGMFDELFAEMPEELKKMLGISPTDLKGEEKEEDFDYDNPPLTCEDIKDSVISAETLKKLVTARKMLIEVGEELHKNATATRLSMSSHYAQAQWLFFDEDLHEVVVKVNTLLHINDPEMSIKKVIDEQAHEQGILSQELVSRLVADRAMKLMFGDLLGNLFD